MRVLLPIVMLLVAAALPAWPQDGIGLRPRMVLYASEARGMIPPAPKDKVVYKPTNRRKLMWTGLALAGAGAAMFATAGHTVNVPQQCALVPLASFCLPAKTYTDYRQGQQLAGAAMVGVGGVMVWRFGTR